MTTDARFASAVDEYLKRGEIERLDATIRLFENLNWFWSLPRRYKLIVSARRVRAHLERSWSRYESTITKGINTHEKALELWRREACEKCCVTWKQFQEGELLDDLRDYRLTCEDREGFYELPMACSCPFAVKREL